MATTLVEPGFYWTQQFAPPEAGWGPWEELAQAAQLDTDRRGEQYGNCLSLSGGGYRAALFHLGVLRRLNEVGMLGHLDTIACVSGGSMIGGFLANTIRKNPGWWPAPGETIPTDSWERTFAEPVRQMTERDIRSAAALVGGLPVFALSKGVETIEEQLAETYDRIRLRDLPRRPNFLFCATELERADYWVFGRHHVGPYEGFFKLVLPDYPVARAVAASACFPPVFDPQETDFYALLKRLPERPEPIEVDEPTPSEELGAAGYPRFLDFTASYRMFVDEVGPNVKDYLRRVRLSDGGVFDNNGIEAVWARAKFLLVSDAGGAFQLEWRRWLKWRLKRYLDIRGYVGQAGQLRWLEALGRPDFQGDQLPSLVVSTKAFDPDPHLLPGETLLRYPASLRRQIARIRTDLDSFRREEIEILENAGYLEANEQLRHYPPEAIAPRYSSSVAVPWPDLMDPDRAEAAIRESHKIKPLGHKGVGPFLKARTDLWKRGHWVKRLLGAIGGNPRRR